MEDQQQAAPHLVAGEIQDLLLIILTSRHSSPS